MDCKCRDTFGDIQNKIYGAVVHSCESSIIDIRLVLLRPQQVALHLIVVSLQPMIEIIG
jgi:hypothetical protein